MAKRILFPVLLTAFALVMFSCSKDKEDSFNENFLYGEWRDTGDGLHYLYRTNHTGLYWDPGQDQTEEDSDNTYTWSLDKSKLNHTITLLLGGVSVFNVTVTELTATTLKYKDSFESYSLVKVK